MRTGRPTPPVVLTADERQTLEQWARRPTTAQGLAQRARLVLACASTKTNGEIAAFSCALGKQLVTHLGGRGVRARLEKRNSGQSTISYDWVESPCTIESRIP